MEVRNVFAKQLHTPCTSNKSMGDEYSLQWNSILIEWSKFTYGLTAGILEYFKGINSFKWASHGWPMKSFNGTIT